MGGHGHGHDHHHAPYKVPSPNIYKVDNTPELVYLRDELMKRGLKDPWIRNEVWRFNREVWGNPRTRILKFLFRGLPLGLTLAAATVGYEEYFEVYKHDHGHDAHGSDNSHH